MENPKATIFNIQRFSIHDGPGIRTLIFMKGCPLKCIWCSNPESQSTAPELVFYSERCIQLNRCIGACQAHAISLQGSRLVLDQSLCNLCGDCVKACHAEAWNIFGREVDLNYIMQEVQKDTLFYKNSGGGVTFGGGEPLVWPDFVSAASKQCHKHGIHVAIETCGYAPWNVVEKILNSIDLVIYDIKHINPQVHEKLCGQSNGLILDNLKAISQRCNVEVIIRIPIIPGLNDSEANITGIARFVASLNGNIKRVELLPYHKLGIKKYERLTRTYRIGDVEAPSSNDLKDIKKILEHYGLNVEIGG